ncbi:hypothetical protein GCM10009765_44210 [Fodinicola feengrottensis]|uniref:Uncharacterized protein n=1 Tax=Fodinicola feengrottensis TaxID=435914 RepID=A0ABN2HLR7_9ACTN
MVKAKVEAVADVECALADALELRGWGKLDQVQFHAWMGPVDTVQVRGQDALQDSDTGEPDSYRADLATDTCWR